MQSCDFIGEENEVGFSQDINLGLLNSDQMLLLLIKWSCGIKQRINSTHPQTRLILRLDLKAFTLYSELG